MQMKSNSILYQITLVLVIIIIVINVPASHATHCDSDQFVIRRLPQNRDKLTVYVQSA